MSRYRETPLSDGEMPVGVGETSLSVGGTLASVEQISPSVGQPKSSTTHTLLQYLPTCSQRFDP